MQPPPLPLPLPCRASFRLFHISPLLVSLPFIALSGSFSTSWERAGSLGCKNLGVPFLLLSLSLSTITCRWKSIWKLSYEALNDLAFACPTSSFLPSQPRSSLQPHWTHFCLSSLTRRPPGWLFSLPAPHLSLPPPSQLLALFLANRQCVLNIYWIKQCLNYFLFCSLVPPHVSFKKILIFMPICILYLGLHTFHTGFCNCAVWLLLETGRSSLSVLFSLKLQVIY